MSTSTVLTRSSYADRAAHYRALSGNCDAAEFAARAEHAHITRPWLRAAVERDYDDDDCCVECGEHISDPHAPQCPHADLAYAEADDHAEAVR